MELRLTTERLDLRSVPRDVAHAVYSGSPPQGVSMSPGYPSIDRPGAFDSSDRRELVIFQNREGVVIGDCAVTLNEAVVEISYCVAEPQQGLGYGSEAIIELVSWLLARPEVRCVEAT